MKTNHPQYGEGGFALFNSLFTEDFLHYIWRYQLFDKNRLQTTDGVFVQVLKPGYYNQQSGPDFFNARILIGEQEWAGNIEIHRKSSDWYAHKHEIDPNYDAVILHVVWEYDVPVFYANSKEIETVELKSLVSEERLNQYAKLITTNEKWIACESELIQMPSVIIKSWMSRLYVERLEEKTAAITKILSENNNDWEATFFIVLAKAFGMRLNGESFLNLATSLDFSLVRKYLNQKGQMEVLLMGQAGFLEETIEDVYFLKLQKEYRYLKKKHKLLPLFKGQFQFFRTRPTNFPTIRLAQLGQLYEQRKKLFAVIVAANHIREFYTIFQVGTSRYWDTHYTFGKETKKTSKQVSKSFVNVLLINAIIPMKYAFYKFKSIDFETLETLITNIDPERNAVITAFGKRGVKAESALESQALLQLKSNYCNKKRCLQCAIGMSLLQRSS
ncbi:DUF2851 family protein [Flavicella marina]|uniref:DUF2851 family protein n=1 Tax=Flavicella marina TaxID=1475951 RepID=UPI0012650DAD|nr:DUF2851 family protein [Flavicella marina]